MKGQVRLKGGTKGYNAAGAGAGGGGKGGKNGKGGKGDQWPQPWASSPQTGPKAPGIQNPVPCSNMGGQAWGGKGANTINYKLAQENPSYKAQASQVWLDAARGIFGADSKEVEMAEKAAAAAQQEAESRRTPQERATALREDRTSYIDAIAKRVRRIQSLQKQRQEFDDELVAIDCENKQDFEHVAHLDQKIEEYELQSGLKKPIPTGGQLNMQPKEMLKRRLQDTVQLAKAAIEATGALDVPDKLREYMAALKVLQGKSADLTATDEIMSATDVAPPDDEREAEEQGEPKAKTPRRQEQDTVTQDAAMAESEAPQEAPWTEVLGPMAKRAQKLADKTFQDIAKKLQTPSPTVGPSKGKACGKGGATKGNGKGPLAVFKQSTTAAGNASQTPRPQEGADRGAPPMVPGVPFPPAGGTPPTAQATSLSTGSATPARPLAPGEQPAQTSTGLPRPQLSEEEWKEVLANRGGRWPPHIVHRLHV